MSKMAALNDDDLELVAGGDISYTWDGSSGRIGINGNNVFILVDKDYFVSYYNSVYGTKKDSEILTHLLSVGAIRQG